MRAALTVLILVETLLELRPIADGTPPRHMSPATSWLMPEIIINV